MAAVLKTRQRTCCKHDEIHGGRQEGGARDEDERARENGRL
jgi:hypothetical protein